MPLGQDVAVTPTEPPTPCHIDRDSDVAVRHLGRPATVLVCRDGGGWSAEVAALGVARTARSLVTLDRQVRELLSTETVDYHFRTGDGELDRLVRVRQLLKQQLATTSGQPYP